MSDEQVQSANETDDEDHLPAEVSCLPELPPPPISNVEHIASQDEDSDQLTGAVNHKGVKSSESLRTQKLLETSISEQDSNWQKVREEVTCAICLQLLDEPKSMPCLHTYCKKCLMEAFAKRPRDPNLPRDRPAINCPLCRAEVALSDRGIETLPSNFSATRLVETVQLQDRLEQNRAPKCDGCKENNAVASCCKCGGFFLCENCFKVHKQLPSTKNHSILSLDEFMQSKTSLLTANRLLLCERHPQELLKLYCKDCEMLVCRDCVLVRHKSHNYSFVDEIIEEEKAHLQDVTLKELEEILTGAKETITSVENTQATVLSNNEDQLAQMTANFEEIKCMLDKRKDDLSGEIGQITEDDLYPLQKQQKDLGALKINVENCYKFTKKTLQDGTSLEIMSARKQMLERTKYLQELHKNSPTSPVTKPSTTICYQLDQLKEIFKNLAIVVDLQQCSVEDAPETFRVDELVRFHVVLKDTKSRPIRNACGIINAEVIAGDESVTSTVVESITEGNYAVEFLPKKVDDHVVSIKVNNNYISKSPLRIAHALPTSAALSYFSDSDSSF